MRMAVIESHVVTADLRTAHQELHALVSHLKACAYPRDLPRGHRIHANILRNGLLMQEKWLGSALIRMYAHCGTLTEAWCVFDDLPCHDVVSWTALVAACVRHGYGEEALHFCERMQSYGISLNAVTFACALKACGSLGASEKGSEVHAEIVRMGLLGNDAVLGTALVDFYVKCGELTKANEAFDELAVRNMFSWTALMAGYAHDKHTEKALGCFKRMQEEGFSINSVTFLCVLQACSSVGAVEKGKELHAVIAEEGMLENHSVLGNALVDMYAKCGELKMAKRVFHDLPTWTVVSWNALITSCAEQEESEEAIEYYTQMRCKGSLPDAVTLSCILKACGAIEATSRGEEVHAEILKRGLLGNDVILANALIDLYAKAGRIAKAKQEFDEVRNQDVVSWNVLISGFARHGHNEAVLTGFEQMQGKGVAPNTATLLCVLRVCGMVGALEHGMKIHTQVEREGLLRNECVLGSALVDMYGQCGELTKAREVFDSLSFRGVIHWTALMAGYSRGGKHDEVFSLFKEMIGDCTEPNSITFTVLLNACSHVGLMNEGQMYFELISESYGLLPSCEHHTCMVDLFARMGHFDKAMGIVSKVPLSTSYFPAWVALLSACGKWGNAKLGSFAFEFVVQSHTKTIGRMDDDAMSTEEILPTCL